MNEIQHIFIQQSRQRKRRFAFVLVISLIVVIQVVIEAARQITSRPIASHTSVADETKLALKVLERLEVKGRAPKTGYSRQMFSNGWGPATGCDMRNWILKRDLTKVTTQSEHDCTVLSGVLEDDVYTGRRIEFKRGAGSSAVQIEHIVAVSDAWQKGAQQLSPQQRYAFYNDPLNLIAVDGPANVQKGDADAASWLPPNKAYRCRYIARQIAVKAKYYLWVTAAERDAMKRVLNLCPYQLLPEVAA